MVRIFETIPLLILRSHVVSACTSVRLTLDELESDVIGRSMELGGTTGPKSRGSIHYSMGSWKFGMEMETGVWNGNDSMENPLMTWKTLYVLTYVLGMYIPT